MKNLINGSVIFIIFMFIISNPANANDELNLLALDNFAPFSWDEAGEVKGVYVDIVKELCYRTGISCNMKGVPWKRVLAQVKKGNTDGGVAGYKNSEREEYAIYLDYPIHHSTFVIFVKRGNEFSFNRIEDLYGKRVGKNRGFRVSDELDRAAKENKIYVEEVNSIEQNIKKLLAGRLDAFIASLHEALYIMRNMPDNNMVVSLPKPITTPNPVYLFISKAADMEGKTELINQLNKMLKIMWEDGTIENITKKYTNLKIESSPGKP